VDRTCTARRASILYKRVGARAAANLCAADRVPWVAERGFRTAAPRSSSVSGVEEEDGVAGDDGLMGDILGIIVMPKP
jgi:hypothetical protein